MSYRDTPTGDLICNTCQERWRDCNCITCPNCEENTHADEDECLSCGHVIIERTKAAPRLNGECLICSNTNTNCGCWECPCGNHGESEDSECSFCNRIWCHDCGTEVKWNESRHWWDHVTPNPDCFLERC